MALSGLRSAVLSKLRVSVGISSRVQQTAGGAACLTLLRGFAEGTYLDKGQVTERILDVVKNFDKVEPSKVRSLSSSSASSHYLRMRRRHLLSLISHVHPNACPKQQRGILGKRRCGQGCGAGAAVWTDRSSDLAALSTTVTQPPPGWWPLRISSTPHSICLICEGINAAQC